MGKLKQLLIDYDNMSREEMIEVIQDLQCTIEELEERIQYYQDNYVQIVDWEDEEVC